MGQKASTSDVSFLVDDDAYARGDVVRLVVMSDTHNLVSSAAHVPPGDIFLHCGDFTEDGTAQEIAAFNAWLAQVPHKHKVVIPGNHDLYCDPDSYETNVEKGNKRRRELHHAEAARERELRAGLTPDAWRRRVREELLSHATQYLEGGVISLDVSKDGQTPAYVRIATAAYTDIISVSQMRAFALEPDSQRRAFDRALGTYVPTKGGEDMPQSDGPLHVDVLMTHGPPKGVLDTFLRMSTGSETLGAKLAELQELGRAPAVHVFGHVHQAYGVLNGASVPSATGMTALPNTTFINAASKARGERLRPPVVFDLPLSSLRSRRSP